MYCALLFFLNGFIIFSSCAIEHTCDVYPEATCKRSNDSINCLTLSTILNEREECFTSDSTLVFHEGEHILQDEVLHTFFVRNFTLQGYSGSGFGLSSTTITCANSSLHFFYAFIAITSIHFNQCSFSLYRAVAVVQDSRFENGSAVNGGALSAFYSSVQFDGANSFTGNIAEKNGGAVYVYRSTVTFSGTTAFTENTAQHGGAVYCGSDNSLHFSGNSIFMKNTAEWLVGEELFFHRGGAVYALYNNTLRFDRKSSFMSNTADDGGGAVCAMDGNTLRFGGKSSFMSNIARQYGGAVYAWNSNTLRFDEDSSFMSNTADDEGGAVYACESNTLSFDGNSSFMSNAAKYGGAVTAANRNVLTFNGSSSFVNSTAHSFGGAVYAWDSNTVSFDGNSSFISNAAKYYGGAVTAVNRNVLTFNGSSSFVNSTAHIFGGAVYVWDSNTLSFNTSSSFLNNTSHYRGGVVYAEDNNTLNFDGNNSFMSNTADDHGGAVYAEYNNTFNFVGSCSFMSNTADDHGGAVYAEYNNTFYFVGSFSFMSNTARSDGGAVFAVYANTLTFDGNSIFMSNKAGDDGGAVYARNSNTLSFDGKSSFTGNTANDRGVVCARDNNTLSLDGSSTFMSNTAEWGGAVYAGVGNTLSFHGNSSFMNNTAGADGGAVDVQGSSLSFYGISILVNNEAVQGGGITLSLNSLLYLSGKISLVSNIASFGGGAFVQDSSIDSTDNIAVVGNEAIHGGGLFVQSSNIRLQSSGLLTGNTATNAEGGYGGAIFARGSVVEFKGSFDITNNTAGFGGGMAFFGVHDSVLMIKESTNLTFEGNLASRRGGAIYVEDDPFTFCPFENVTQSHVNEVCFFQITDRPYGCFQRHESPDDLWESITLKFNNNTASVSGDIMYGGHLNSCVVCSASSSQEFTLGAETYLQIAKSETDVFSKLSSDPYKVCLCEESYPNCDLRQVNRTVYPGQVLLTSVVAVGQMNGIVPSVIRALSDNLADTPGFQETQPAENSKQCSQLQYPLFSSMPSTSLKLYSDEPCSTSGYSLTFLINFLPCPIGFTLSNQACVCDERLQKYTQNCSIQNLTISRDAGDSFWVGVEGSDKLILHPHCPFDYCTDEPVYLPLNSTDMQCASGRSGILCGACRPGRGLALGSSRCLSGCSDRFLALLLAFAFAGVALVSFLFLSHLTVAEGTLSGLIFYANVLAVNQTVFFPSGERNLLTVFIAWLNLDLGIETCFFVGLDAYDRTWLQFAFPIYIWVIVGVIIVFADRSTAFAKIIGKTNPVAVLATLFLLSYTKLLRAIMAAFSFTTLDYPEGDSKYVWLYDGNIGYLDRHDGRHIALFLFSLLFFLFVFLPYTLLLLCGQWMQKKLWWLSPTWQLFVKFFLDAHYGPYKTRHCYWTGLLLLIRFLMLFVSTIININNPQDPYSNLLVIQAVTSSLIAWGWFIRGLYKKWYHDILEGSFILNLVVLAGGTYQVRLSGGNQTALVYTSVSIAFVTFIGIVLSAVIPRFEGKLPDHLRTAIRNRFKINDQSQNNADNSVPTAIPEATVTYSVVEIDHKESGNAEIERENKLFNSERMDP